MRDMLGQAQGGGLHCSYIPVFHAYQVVFRVGSLGECLGYRHRAMLATGASDTDIQVCFSLRLVPGEEKGQEIGISLDEFGRLGGSEYIVPNRRVSTVLLAKFLDKMGIPEKTDIYDEVAIDGNSVFEPKGKKVNPHARSANRT